MISDQESKALQAGATAFDAGRYREALDLFEDAMHRGSRERRELHLALIRAAAALHHWHGGRVLAARRLLASACELLGALPDETPGLDLPRLHAALAEHGRPLLAGAAAEPPAELPALRTEPRGAG